MQSTSNSIDSAGSLLLGRHVLVPRRDHGNRLYLGVIKTQKKDKRFGVVFCIPYAGHGGDDGLEYCMQEVDIDDILSYTDLYRHAICENDDVLVPAILLQPHNTGTSLQIDPPFAGHPYILAVVHKGFEPRSSRITRSPGRKTSTLVVKLAGGRRPRLCDIPAGCALWIPEKQARQLYSQGCHFFDQQEADTRDSSPDHGERESLCMHGAPTSPSRNTDIDDAESQNLTKSSEEFRQINGENSDAFSVLEKRSQSSSRRSGTSSSRSKRPQWQYWGKGGIPSLIDPPSHEPYMPQQVFGPAAIVSSQPGNEWPAAHFAIVNHSLENITAQNDSTRVYEAMRQVDQPPPLSESIGLPVTHSPPNMKENEDLENLFLNPCDADEDGLTGLSLRKLYHHRLRENLKEAKTASACGFNRRKSSAKSIKSQ
ncbi:unnamed protein product [Hymenolepis diminuta]|uniref:CABIT domain-containing protein n=1 Tax=Hymenolepis diminuta TaxID=6216 RepID=A0A0R3SG14_HYMDI|nr:unnamed protein product [Hymenolepis diminuta]